MSELGFMGLLGFWSWLFGVSVVVWVLVEWVGVPFPILVPHPSPLPLSGRGDK